MLVGITTCGGYYWVLLGACDRVTSCPVSPHYLLIIILHFAPYTACCRAPPHLPALGDNCPSLPTVAEAC